MFLEEWIVGVDKNVITLSPLLVPRPSLSVVPN